MDDAQPDYRFYEGWFFQRLDPTHIEVYQHSFCIHCHRELSKNSRVFAERDDHTPINAGLKRAMSPALRGGQSVKDAPDFCEECLDAD